MILDFISLAEKTSRPWRWIVAAVALLVLAAFGFARCQSPAPPVPPTAQAIASSSTATTLTNDLEMIIPASMLSRNSAKMSTGTAHPADSQAPQTWLKNRNSEPQMQPESGGAHAQEEPIIIRIKQTATAAASSEASASTMPAMAIVHGPMPQEHARLGAFIGTVPGAIALTYQLADVEIPPWVLGTPLELGLEVEGNAQQLGAGISLGSKAFGIAGGYVGWSGPGWYVGAGMRF